MSLPKDPQKREEYLRRQSESQKARYQEGRIPWNKGKKHTPEAITRMSAAQKGRKRTQASRKGIPNPKNSRPMTEATKAKLSVAKMGQPAWNKGIPISEEQKAKLFAGRDAKPMSPESRAQAGASNRGRKRTPEQRARMRAAQKGKVISAEQRAQISASQKGKPGRRTGIPQSPETIKRMSEIGRQQWENMTEEQKAAKAELLRASAKDITRSSLEEVIALELDAQGIEYERQKRIGWYRVDFYIPAQNCIIEAQGCFWHACEQCGKELHKEKRIADAKRHEYLQRKGYIVKVIWEHERKSELRRFRRMNGGNSGSG